MLFHCRYTRNPSLENEGSTQKTWRAITKPTPKHTDSIMFETREENILECRSSLHTLFSIIFYYTTIRTYLSFSLILPTTRERHHPIRRCVNLAVSLPWRQWSSHPNTPLHGGPCLTVAIRHRHRHCPTTRTMTVIVPKVIIVSGFRLPHQSMW